MNNLDKIDMECVEKKIRYSEWQKRMYPVHVENWEKRIPKEVLKEREESK